jgi:hypothetical protein
MRHRTRCVVQAFEAVVRISGLDRSAVELAASCYAAYPGDIKERIQLDEQAGRAAAACSWVFTHAIRGVRLLLDEMWTPTIALELRKREFDAIAIAIAISGAAYAA